MLSKKWIITVSNWLNFHEMHYRHDYTSLACKKISTQSQKMILARQVVTDCRIAQQADAQTEHICSTAYGIVFGCYICVCSTVTSYYVLRYFDFSKAAPSFRV